MKLQRLCLTLAALLFASWVGWLAYLAATTANPIVVSRPQLFAAPVIVEAETNENGTAVVKRIYRGDDVPGLAVGREIAITGKLSEARYWAGPGLYVLPLQLVEPGVYELVRPPFPPRFQPPPGSDAARPAVYPSSPSIHVQVERALESLAP